jgi:hypothetical protein
MSWEGKGMHSEKPEENEADRVIFQIAVVGMCIVTLCVLCLLTHYAITGGESIYNTHIEKPVDGYYDAVPSKEDKIEEPVGETKANSFPIQSPDLSRGTFLKVKTTDDSRCVRLKR